MSEYQALNKSRYCQNIAKGKNISANKQSPYSASHMPATTEPYLLSSGDILQFRTMG